MGIVSICVLLIHVYDFFKVITYNEQYTLIAWFQGEQSNCFQEVGEKTWETVAQSCRPRATVSHVFYPTKGQQFDCFPRSHATSVLLPTFLYNFVFNLKPILYLSLEKKNPPKSMMCSFPNFARLLLLSLMLQ
jgi:hypothetical protein